MTDTPFANEPTRGRAVHDRLWQLFDHVEDILLDSHPGLIVRRYMFDPPPLGLAFEAHLMAMYDPEMQRYEDLILRFVIGARHTRWPHLAHRQVAFFEIERGDGEPFGELEPLELPDNPLSIEATEAIMSYIDRAETLFREKQSRILNELRTPFIKEEE